MPLSMYHASVPVFVHGLNNLSAILKKAEAHAAAKKIDPSVLIGARLYPDMHPLSRQVQIACDIVKGASARLAQIEVPSFPDTETTFDELQQRIKKTCDFVQSVTESQLEGSEKRTVELKVGGKNLSFTGGDYLTRFVNPNFYFHMSIAYAILRHNGIEIGKADFLGPIS